VFGAPLGSAAARVFTAPTVTFLSRLRSESISWKFLQDFQTHCKDHSLVSKLPLLQCRFFDITEVSFEIRDKRIKCGCGHDWALPVYSRGNGFLPRAF
jgi:hypothetical protein